VMLLQLGSSHDELRVRACDRWKTRFRWQLGQLECSVVPWEAVPRCPLPHDAALRAPFAWAARARSSALDWQSKAAQPDHGPHRPSESPASLHRCAVRDALGATRHARDALGATRNQTWRAASLALVGVACRLWRRVCCSCPACGGMAGAAVRMAPRHTASQVVDGARRPWLPPCTGPPRINRNGWGTEKAHRHLAWARRRDGKGWDSDWEMPRALEGFASAVRTPPPDAWEMQGRV